MYISLWFHLSFISDKVIFIWHLILLRSVSVIPNTKRFVCVQLTNYYLEPADSVARSHDEATLNTGSSSFSFCLYALL
jgi:hypothetical protein